MLEYADIYKQIEYIFFHKWRDLILNRTSFIKGLSTNRREPKRKKKKRKNFYPLLLLTDSAVYFSVEEIYAYFWEHLDTHYIYI